MVVFKALREFFPALQVASRPKVTPGVHFGRQKSGKGEKGRPKKTVSLFSYLAVLITGYAAHQLFGQLLIRQNYD